MVELRQQNNLATGSADTTATFHEVSGQEYMYIWGRGEVQRYNLTNFSAEIVDSNIPWEMNDGKAIKSPYDPDKVFLTPRTSDGPSIDANVAVLIDVPSLDYTTTTTFTYRYHNPMFAVVDGTAYWWGGRREETSNGNGVDVSDRVWRINSDGTHTQIGTLGTGVWNAAAGVLDGTAYTFGGFTNLQSGDGSMADIYQVNPAAATQTQVATQTLDGNTFNLANHFGRFFGDFYYAYCGATFPNGGSRTEYSDVWEIDPETGEMNSVGNLNGARLDVITGFDGSQLWSFGGGGDAVSDFYSDAYRLVRTRPDTVLLLGESLGIRGAFVEAGDQCLLHDENHARVELRGADGEDIAMITEDVGQV